MRYLIPLAAALVVSPPVEAQLFWQPPAFTGAPISPGEAGIGQPMPDARPDELQANITWQMRAALNVMALQCQFEPTLLAANVYNGVLINHREELAKTYATLAAYFNRTNKQPKAGRDAFERYGTKTYLGFSTVRAQLGFCQTASDVAKTAIFAPVGSFNIVATERLREIRNSLVPGGEQFFHFTRRNVGERLPDLAKRCWNKRDQYNVRKCIYIEG